MFDIPTWFKNESEGYITIPAMKHFLKKHNLKTSHDREDCLIAITEYGNLAPENEELVLCWMDAVIREGKKETHVKLLKTSDSTTPLFTSDTNFETFMRPLENHSTRHIGTFRFDREYSYIRHEIYQNTLGKCISIYLGRLLYCQNTDDSFQIIPYVVVVEIYPELCFVVGRAKPKSKIYNYDGGEFDAVRNKSTTADSQIENAIKKVVDLFACSVSSKSECVTFFRNNLYAILTKYTQTPIEIQTIMELQHDAISAVVDEIQNRICKVSDGFRSDVFSDVSNLVEKYLSITCPDKSIFTNGRRAFPLRLSATDEEDSRVDQAAGKEEPLQSKAIFFDNKRMLIKTQTCDSVFFCYNREDTKYYRPVFQVKININNSKDYCSVKFPEYTQEEDIQNVLFEIINPKSYSISEADRTA